MFTEERRMMILAELEQCGSVSIVKAAEKFGVSVVTIRKDLDELAKARPIQRTRGGALVRKIDLPLDWDLRAGTQAAEKEAIGRAAAGLIRAGETVMLDSGTTVARLAMNLGIVGGVNCITACVRVAALASMWPNVALSLTGGLMRGDLPLSGPDCLRTILAHRGADKAFLSVAGVSLEAGLTEAYSAAVPAKRALIESSREVILLADSTKFGTAHGDWLADVSVLDRIITGRALPAPIVDTLRKMDIDVILV